ncbi:hypothetical protein JOM56_001497 [Amanita muscaria]
MLHSGVVPSNNYSKRSSGTFTIQPGSYSNPLLRKVDEELHDARRVQSYGQEEDLRAALGLVINRVVELSSLLNEAYKTQAELEVQLNVTKSNLQLVISNNEMLEEALKHEANGHSQHVGWHRRSGRDAESISRVSEDGRRSSDSTSGHESSSNSATMSSTIPVASPAAAPSSQDSRFFKFRFTGSSSTSPRPATRPATPSGTKGSGSSPTSTHHLASSSMPALPLTTTKEMDELSAELEKERAARKTVLEQKAALEDELESLSQALFEEANKMVATERIKRAETEEELKEARLEQEALRSALRLLEGENAHFRRGTQTAPPSISSPSQDLDNESPNLTSSVLATRTRLRSSSQIAIKSPIASPRSSASIIPSSAPTVLADPESHSGENAAALPPESHVLDDPLITPIGTSFQIRDLDSVTHQSLTTDTQFQPSRLYGDLESSPWVDVPPRTSNDVEETSSSSPRNKLIAG